MRSPMMLYCITVCYYPGLKRNGTNDHKHATCSGWNNDETDRSPQNEGNFLYFRKWRTKVLLVVCIFSKMSFSYSRIWSVFLISFVWQRYWICMYFFCVWFVRLCCIVGHLCFFSRPDLEGKIFQWGLSFNLVHKQHCWTSTRLLCVRLWLPYRFIVILPPSLVIYLFYNLVATITPHFEEVSPYSSWIKFTKFTHCSLILNSWSFGSFKHIFANIFALIMIWI